MMPIGRFKIFILERWKLLSDKMGDGNPKTEKISHTILFSKKSKFWLSKMRTQFTIGCLLFLFVGCSSSPDIKVESMTMNSPNASQTFKEELLNGEIADTKIERVILASPALQTVSLSKENVNMFLFIKGEGRILADTTYYFIVPETIAIPTSYSQIVFDTQIA